LLKVARGFPAIKPTLEVLLTESESLAKSNSSLAQAILLKARMFAFLDLSRGRDLLPFSDISRGLYTRDEEELFETVTQISALHPSISLRVDEASQCVRILASSSSSSAEEIKTRLEGVHDSILSIIDTRTLK
jgi:hypothetical protein